MPKLLVRNVLSVVEGKHAYETLSVRGLAEFPSVTLFGPEFGIAASTGFCGFCKGVASGSLAWAQAKRYDLVSKPPRFLAGPGT